MGHMILAALCVWSCIMNVMTVTQTMTEDQVGRVTEYIRQKYTGSFNFEYAYLVKFTDVECNGGLTDDIIKNALKDEKAKDMSDKVKNFRIYEGKRMVVTSFSTYTVHGQQRNLHAEYRLLDPDYFSPSSNLMANGIPNGCAIFFSLYSPCAMKCLRPDGNYNIVDKLDKVNGLPQNKVFAFKYVYDKEIHTPFNQLWESWETLNKSIRLFRCNGNNCIYCFKSGTQQGECSDGLHKP